MGKEFPTYVGELGESGARGRCGVGGWVVGVVRFGLLVVQL